MIDEILKPCLNNVHSYIRDTADFVNYLCNNPDISEAEELITYDVESLYTNISHALGKN